MSIYKFCLIIAIKLVICSVSYSQVRDISMFQGIWRTEDNMNVAYIVNDGVMLKVVFESDLSEIMLLKIKDVGFISKEIVESERYNLKEHLKRKGKVGIGEYVYFNTLYTFFEEPTPNFMELFNNKVHVYIKDSLFENEKLLLVYKRGLRDKRDYILEFLNIDVREIITSKSSLYNLERKQTEFILERGDIVEIESIDEEFAKVTYNKNDEKLIKGYVRYSDISKKSPIPSFDPKKASTPIEKAICSDVVLASLDRQLAMAYKEAKTKYGDKVKNEQFAWIKKRNIACKNKSQEEKIGLLKDLYAERLKALNQSLN